MFFVCEFLISFLCLDNIKKWLTTGNIHPFAFFKASNFGEEKKSCAMDY